MRLAIPATWGKDAEAYTVDSIGRSSVVPPNLSTSASYVVCSLRGGGVLIWLARLPARAARLPKWSSLVRKPAGHGSKRTYHLGLSGPRK